MDRLTLAIFSYDADVNALSDCDDTPLHDAVTSGNEKVNFDSFNFYWIFNLKIVVIFCLNISFYAFYILIFQ